MPSSIAASTVSKLQSRSHSTELGNVGDVLSELIEAEIPNFFRLYLNPHVAQACTLVAHAHAVTWGGDAAELCTFLANGREEGLSGAVKLLRYALNSAAAPTRGLLIDPCRSLSEPFLLELPHGARVELVPDIEAVADPSAAQRLVEQGQFGWAAIELAQLQEKASPWPSLAAQWNAAGRRLRWIVVVRRDDLGLAPRPRQRTSRRRQRAATAVAVEPAGGIVPDIAVFDESWTNFQTPWTALVASRTLFRHWRRRGMATFHSTTFQPNSVSNMQFVRCCERHFPDFFAEHAPELARIAADPRVCARTLARRYSPSLVRLIRATGFDRCATRAAGHYVWAGGRRLFDGVAGVACSLRGHNPPDYVARLRATPASEQVHQDLTTHLERLAGLPHWAPASSGAAAVEQALRWGLAAQYPRTHVLALEGGFGGKTLFALTGTSRPRYKRRLGPLYPHVVYVDPFAHDAVDQIERACGALPVGILQYELIQGVGGVRALPTAVVDCLRRMRALHGCLLLADEVQTGVFRTGPFLRSSAAGLRPDLLTLGKAASDMMFPLSLALCSGEVADRAASRDALAPPSDQRRRTFDVGYRTLLATLDQDDAELREAAVRRQGEAFAERLATELAGVAGVREVRCYGLLIGIELTAARGVRRRLTALAPQLYLLQMLADRQFPLLMGYCQYDPHVLKFTPPLTVTDGEIVAASAAIGRALRRPLARLAVQTLARTMRASRWSPLRCIDPIHDWEKNA